MSKKINISFSVDHQQRGAVGGAKGEGEGQGAGDYVASV